MLDDLLLLAFCILIGLLALAVCGWDIISGWVFSLDGLLLLLLGLLIGVIFLGNVAWSARAGELQQVLGELRGKARQNPATNKPPDEPRP